MPRGPGKKENYNFDYSRFNGAVEGEADVDAKSEEPGGIPADMMKNLPGELQEAFRLMTISNQTGDRKAQERSNELVMAAIQKGGPEIQKRFSEEVMKHAAKNPEAKEDLEKLVNGQLGGPAAAREAQTTGGQLHGLAGTIKTLEAQMKTGAETTAAQLQKLQQQQEALEQLKGPEDFGRFMASQGLDPEDLQRAMSGDEAHMKAMFEKAIGKIDTPDTVGKAQNLEQALTVVDDIHKTLNDLSGPDGPEASPPMPPAPAPKRPAEPARPEPKIPVHRVQYGKDEGGRLQTVELKCELPGVESMDAIVLDVSDRHLRLRTEAPAFVVSVGPFPCLVDAASARAKFSKKRQELTLTVQAKP
mmetsp:Transcript_25931/g.68554  ORF Transcript_25931/g.68554 Transcript_25931/m.68554 type:complete len:360 (-) Transcript_25931:56-1135(-)